MDIRYQSKLYSSVARIMAQRQVDGFIRDMRLCTHCVEYNWVISDRVCLAEKVDINGRGVREQVNVWACIQKKP